MKKELLEKRLRRFLYRQPSLTFRRPQGISSARLKGFTQENVDKFFDILEPALQKIGNNTARIYNVDKTGITNVQSKHSKVISLKGKRQVGTITVAERGFTGDNGNLLDVIHQDGYNIYLLNGFATSLNIVTF